MRIMLATLAALTVTSTAGCGPVTIDSTTTATETNSSALQANESGTVTAVIDGDTIDVATEVGTERIRIIGIDTPEISRDGGTSDCYAAEARASLNTLVYGQDVQLHADPSQADRDRYDRLLRHVTLGDQNIALTLIEEGAGYEYTYDLPYQGQAEHLAAESAAEANSRGLWGTC